MIFGTLGVIQMALFALGIPHGRGGAQAAVEFWRRVCRRNLSFVMPGLPVEDGRERPGGRASTSYFPKTRKS
jgi:hypothetical protein